MLYLSIYTAQPKVNVSLGV